MTIGRSNTADIFTIRAAGDVRFPVHKAFRGSVSTYFDTMFNSGFAETHSHEVSYPSVDAETITAFLEWLYRTRLIDMNGTDGLAPDAEFSYQSLFKLHVFAHECDIHALSRDTFLAFYAEVMRTDFVEVVSWLDGIAQAWDKLEHESAWCLLLIDLMAWEGNKLANLRNKNLTISFEPNNLPKAFLEDVESVKKQKQAMFDNTVPAKGGKKVEMKPPYKEIFYGYVEPPYEFVQHAMARAEEERKRREQLRAASKPLASRGGRR